jgi:hypothetical protein
MGVGESVCEARVAGVLLDPREGEVDGVAALGEQPDRLAEVADVAAVQHEPLDAQRAVGGLHLALSLAWPRSRHV